MSWLSVIKEGPLIKLGTNLPWDQPVSAWVVNTHPKMLNEHLLVLVKHLATIKQAQLIDNCLLSSLFTSTSLYITWINYISKSKVYCNFPQEILTLSTCYARFGNQNWIMRNFNWRNSQSTKKSQKSKVDNIWVRF